MPLHRPRYTCGSFVRVRECVFATIRPAVQTLGFSYKRPLCRLPKTQFDKLQHTTRCRFGLFAKLQKMTFEVLAPLIVVLAVSTTSVLGHGRLIDPAHRGYAFEVGFKTPKNWNNNENFCGGYTVRFCIIFKNFTLYFDYERLCKDWFLRIILRRFYCQQTQHNVNKGKCGVCGDNYADRQPRANENGGTYGIGTIVRTLVYFFIHAI